MSFGDVSPPGALPPSLIDYPVVIAADPPADPWRGMLWMDRDTNIAYAWDGAAWVPIASEGGGGGLPPATAPSQLIRSSAVAGFPWELTTAIDAGRY